MMVMADNNFLIRLVDDKQTYRIFNQHLERQDIVLGIPTPVIGEFLVRDDNFERADFLSKVNNFTQIFDYDMKSARISAKIFSDLLNADYVKNNNHKRQVIKVDIQIIAITLANGVSKLYTENKGLVAIINELNLPINIVDFEKDEFISMPLFQEDAY